MTQKVTRRLMPFLFTLYVVAFLDRVNVSFAQLQMNGLPWMSAGVFGFGSGIFFLGYFLFEVPSNLILERVGARFWIARIMITWGIIASAMMFTSSPWMFYTLRFLLGVAEAGFFPGIVLYLTYWYPAGERARIVGLLMVAVPISGVIGGPLSGLLLEMSGFGRLQGWQWMFLLEGLPAVLLGFAVLAFLPNGPGDARWLSDSERGQLAAALAEEGPTAKKSLREFTPVSLRVVATCAMVYFGYNVAGYGITLWTPQIIDDLGKMTPFQVGLLSALPRVAGAICMVIAGAHSDRTGERKFHVVWPLFLCGGCLLVSSETISLPWVSFICLSIANSGMLAIVGPFWASATASLSRGSAAAAIALINALGTLGGFFGPTIVGCAKQATNSYELPLMVLAVSAMLGSVAALKLPTANRPIARA